MKKKLPLICNVISIALMLAFVIKCIIDYKQYLLSFGSAPFNVWVFVNTLYMLVPSAIVFTIGLIAKKKQL